MLPWAQHQSYVELANASQVLYWWAWQGNVSGQSWLEDSSQFARIGHLHHSSYKIYILGFSWAQFGNYKMHVNGKQQLGL